MSSVKVSQPTVDSIMNVPASQTQTGDPVALVSADTTSATPIVASDKLDSKVSMINSKATSDIWNYFEKKKVNKDVKAKCFFYGKEYLANSKNGTSTLWTHFHKCPKNTEKAKNKKQNTLSFQKGNENMAALLNVKFDSEVLKKGLCKMIITDELPYKFVEKEGFRNFIQLCESRFQMPSRHIVARGCMQLYIDEKKKLAAFLRKSSQRICFTTDTWTSLQNINYMCHMGHFIDDDWKLNKRILNFCPISSHRGDDIGREVGKCLNAWNIEQIFTITVDNSSSNDTALTYLKKKFGNRDENVLSCEFMHMRCVAHILNLVVSNGLKGLDVSIKRIRDAVRYVRSSPQRLKRFQECLEQEKIQSKSHLCLDVVTRWNSTYLMLESALKFQKAFDSLEELNRKYVEEITLKNGLPDEDDWEKAKVLVKFLKTFYDVTLRISGYLYVTANNFFLKISSILFQLNDWILSHSFLLKSMVVKMKDKFDKYWGSIEKMNMLLFVALVLDPRYKLKYLKAIFNQIYDRDQTFRLAKRVIVTLVRLVECYGDKSSSNKNMRMSQNVDAMEIDERESPSHLSLLKSRLKDKLEEEESLDLKSELDKYLDEQRENDVEQFDILNWWKVNSSRFPILSSIAKDVLVIPVSMDASESTFSVGGRVLDSFRSSLTPPVVESLICGQDWLRSSPLDFVAEESMDDVEKLESDLAALFLE